MRATLAFAVALSACGGGTDANAPIRPPPSQEPPAPKASSKGSAAPGQCLSAEQVQSVVTTHQVAMQRVCWEWRPTAHTTASVTLMFTVGPDGSPVSVSATGDDDVVASCIQNDVQQWRFPAMGCSQSISVPFQFSRQ
jgi:hypothetical protein